MHPSREPATPWPILASGVALIVRRTKRPLGASPKLVMSGCESPERAGKSDTSQVVGSSARLAADIATLEATGVLARQKPPQRRQFHQVPALAS
jgi:hypothetical protein